MTTNESQIDLGRAFSYILDDSAWPVKLGITAVVSAVTVVFVGGPLWLAFLTILPPETIQQLRDLRMIPAQLATLEPSSGYALLVFPFALGLVGVALLLGYYIELTRNVRAGHEKPIPAWRELGAMMLDGGGMALAYLLYLLSNLALGALIVFTLRVSLDPEADALLILLGVFCCLLPVVAAYGTVILFVTSIAVIPYSESGEIIDFFNWGKLWRMLYQNRGLTGQWFLFGVLANFGIGAAGQIPVLGILISLSLSIPVQGHLLGQYAAALDRETA